MVHKKDRKKENNLILWCPQRTAQIKKKLQMFSTKTVVLKIQTRVGSLASLARSIPLRTVYAYIRTLVKALPLSKTRKKSTWTPR